jgi:hypothetical protein
VKPRLAAATLAGTVFAVLAFGVYALWSGFRVEYAEGPLADQARRLLAGRMLYQADLARPPFTVDNYPPVFPLVTAGLARVTHLSVLRAGRLVSLLAALAGAALIARLARRDGDDRVPGCFAATLFLSHFFVIQFAVVARVDLLALAFSLGALALLRARPRSAAIALSASVCCVLATFTRQTYALATPLACIAFLWQERRANALLFAAMTAAMTAFGVLLLQHLTDGGFWLHVIRSNINAFSFLRLGEFAGRFVLASAPMIVLVRLAWHRPATSWERALLVYAVAAGVAAVTVGKVGSMHNYWLELVAALALLAAPALSTWRAAPRARVLLAQTAWTACLFAPALWHHPLPLGFLAPAPSQAVATLMRSSEGPVLADEAMAILVHEGRTLEYQPFERRQLAAAGLWNLGPIADLLNAQRFGLIVLRDPGTQLCEERWSREILDVIARRYRPLLRDGDFVAYGPVPDLPLHAGAASAR